MEVLPVGTLGKELGVETAAGEQHRVHPQFRIGAAENAVRLAASELGRAHELVDGDEVGPAAQRAPRGIPRARVLQHEVGTERYHERERRERSPPTPPHEQERERDGNDQDAGRERAEEVHDAIARGRVLVGGRDEHDDRRGERDQQRERVPLEEAAPVGLVAHHTATRMMPIGSTTAGWFAWPTPTSSAGRERTFAPPARDAEQQQHRGPFERLLSEEQGEDDRRIREHARGPPTVSQLGERHERGDDASNRAERGPQRDRPVAQQRPHQRGRGPVDDAVRIRDRLAMTEHRHRPRQRRTVPDAGCDPPHIRVVVDTVGRQDDALAEVHAEHDEPGQAHQDARVSGPRSPHGAGGLPGARRRAPPPLGRVGSFHHVHMPRFHGTAALEAHSRADGMFTNSPSLTVLVRATAAVATLAWLAFASDQRATSSRARNRRRRRRHLAHHVGHLAARAARCTRPRGGGPGRHRGVATAAASRRGVAAGVERVLRDRYGVDCGLNGSAVSRRRHGPPSGRDRSGRWHCGGRRAAQRA